MFIDPRSERNSSIRGCVQNSQSTFEASPWLIIRPITAQGFDQCSDKITAPQEILHSIVSERIRSVYEDQLNGFRNSLFQYLCLPLRVRLRDTEHRGDTRNISFVLLHRP